MSTNLRPVCSALIVAVLAVNATAFGKNVTQTQSCYFPGVDSWGLVDWDLGKVGILKISSNTKNRNVVLVGRGKVQNKSRAFQQFIDEVEPECCDCFNITWSMYDVNPKGQINYLAKGKVKKDDE